MFEQPGRIPGARATNSLSLNLTLPRWRFVRNQNVEGNEQTPQEMENVPVSGALFFPCNVWMQDLTRRAVRP